MVERGNTPCGSRNLLRANFQLWNITFFYDLLIVNKLYKSCIEYLGKLEIFITFTTSPKILSINYLTTKIHLGKPVFFKP